MRIGSEGNVRATDQTSSERMTWGVKTYLEEIGTLLVVTYNLGQQSDFHMLCAASAHPHAIKYQSPMQMHRGIRFCILGTLVHGGTD